jgi:aryl-alcohol dehydrogenase-like predicted oxidoreductase
VLTRPIPSTGEQLPVIGLGTWQTFDTSPSAPLEEVLTEFVALGGTLVDSSPMYGRAEAVVGVLAQKLGLQSQLFLATKVWTAGKSEGIAQIEDSLHNLRTERLDLLQVHNLLDVETQLETLRELKAQGRIRYLGITHYHSSGHADVEALLRREQLDFLQINYSAVEREIERRILPLAAEKGVAVIANRPLASGSLMRRLRGKTLPTWAPDLDCRSWSQILLKFVISHPAITCAIPATSKVQHLRDNMAAGTGRMPDARQRAAIASAIA